MNKPKPMKKIAKLLLSLFLFILVLYGCNCGTCSQVTEVDGVETGRTPGIVYCGDEYDEKQNEEPVIIGNTKTYWDCD